MKWVQAAFSVRNGKEESVDRLICRLEYEQDPSGSLWWGEQFNWEAKVPSCTMASGSHSKRLCSGNHKATSARSCPLKNQDCDSGLKKNKSIISISTDWEHLLVDVRELCRPVALLYFTAKAIEMPFLSCSRVSGRGEITATSAEFYLTLSLLGKAKGTPWSECFQQHSFENSLHQGMFRNHNGKGQVGSQDNRIFLDSSILRPMVKAGDGLMAAQLPLQTNLIHFTDYCCWLQVPAPWLLLPGSLW